MTARHRAAKGDRARLAMLVDSWRESLIDLSFRNRLLNYQRRATSVGMDVSDPGVLDLLEALGRGCLFAAIPDADAPSAPRTVALAKPAGDQRGGRPIDTPASRSGVGRGGPSVELVTSKTSQVELERHLRRLASVTREKFNDYGLWVLHLGVGFVDWTPAASAEKAFSSPLVMVPVVLERRRGGNGVYVLKAQAGEEPTLNPALKIKMDELGVDWPRDEQVELAHVPDLINRIRRAVGTGRRGWKVTDRVVLDTFNSSKEVMYNDLTDNMDRILDSDLVRAVGLGPASGVSPGTFAFTPADPSRIDILQPPEQAPLVLDADTSQRQCVAAALDGRSFVMDGPPGTGKSQTITNIIAGLLEQGRTVLFVSEKAAALDVVRNRLRDVGLDDFVLALHSNSAGRKQVAQELGRAFSADRRTVSAGATVEVARARELREELSGYADAMNDIDPHLGSSLHDVLGRIALLDGDDLLPADRAFDAAHLTAAALDEILDAAGRVARSWRPALEGREFAWYGLTAKGDPLRSLDLARESLRRLNGALGPHRTLLSALGWEGVGNAARLVELLGTAERRPDLPRHWLTADQAELVSRVDEFWFRWAALAPAEARAAGLLGADWIRLPEGPTSEPDTAETALADLVPKGLHPTALTAPEAQRIADALDADANTLTQAAQSLAGVAGLYGLPAPTTYADALRLNEVTEFSSRPDHAKPLPGWLSPVGAVQVRTAVDALRGVTVGVRSARAKAGSQFTEKVLEEPELESVAERFATVHRSFMGRMSGACRSDRKLVRGLLPDGRKCSRAVVAALPDAVAWQRAQREFEATAHRYRDLLGPYWRGEDTDFPALEAAAARGARIVALAPVVLDPAALAREVARGGAPREAARLITETTTAALTAWNASLVFPPTPGPTFELASIGLLSAAAWSRAHVEPLRTAERLIRVVAETASPTAVPPGGSWTLGTARDAIRAVHAARAVVAAFTATADRDRALLGNLYTGRATDRAAVSAALRWNLDLRRACGLTAAGAPTDAVADRLYAAGTDEELANAQRSWWADAGALAAMFRPERAAEVSAYLFLDAKSAGLTLQRLNDDRSGPSEWHAYYRGRWVLDEKHLGDLVDRAVRNAIPHDRFEGLVERSALHAWADGRLDRDPRLGMSRSGDRDAAVVRFQAVDTALAEHARARIVRICDGRRPRSATTEAAVLIHRQGELKSRHKRVRDLLDQGRQVVRLIKPCFMMSPLTVSRFLPPDLTFDVVIFDEASQVLPQDAVNSIYRGKALIVAGDQKQLPPTTFFSSAGGDEEDQEDEETPERFESLLDLCKASGLIPSLSLRWHYRSRHEDLIAFSNREFYGESMTTFPGAHAEGDDVGVAFFHAAEGVYRSGAAARNNPGEAAAVAERVIRHFSTRKGKSLGVVALSQQQALAIQDAVDVARRGRPDLDDCFSEGRLDGFFVKNLETVQGDERDVMIMSVGYGPDAYGKFSMNFGPMNKADGWRRLNVAATRARFRMEVVASFDPDEMRLTDSRGLRHFHNYLRYVRSGHAVLAHEPDDANAGPESPFEESVLAVLRGWGYDVQPQVGVARYRIDLGIRHPQRPGLYVLGVECDGAMYHSSKAARERDRLRESVLSGLGWRLYRIWGTDWYRDRSTAEARLRAAVEAAVRTAPAPAGAASPVVPTESTPAPPRTAAKPPVSSGATRPERPTARAANPQAGKATPAAYPIHTLGHTARERVQHELRQIQAALTGPALDDSAADARVRADNRRRRERLRPQLEERAAFLRELVDNVPAAGRTTGTAPLVAPGRLVSLIFGDEAEEFEISSQQPMSHDTQALSPFTPLGAALLWRQAGTSVEYADGSGTTRTVRIRSVRD
ncbi:DUF4011 domain-containing protein [Streptomyces sp. SID3343]|uniref:DUF4011 domain-containing protein n=1 Tax=Streptomyces sp. SID3343 TaxID=2690260 RepID=UPI0013715A0A|nr:DUF4011 domain-containing protein [Streptomyces sp. SID3343]MYW05321.1 DUF4011 domain-containing protein [Streptomyces sp. SID3343]